MHKPMYHLATAKKTITRYAFADQTVAQMPISTSAAALLYKNKVAYTV
jgi:hypothetical protein